MRGEDGMLSVLISVEGPRSGCRELDVALGYDVDVLVTWNLQTEPR